MAKSKADSVNIIIKDLDQETINYLEEIKRLVKEKTTSKAVLFAINDYVQLIRDRNAIQEENDQLKDELKDIKETLQNYFGALNEAKTYLDPTKDN